MRYIVIVISLPCINLNGMKSRLRISFGIIGFLVGLVQGILIWWINPKLGDKKSIYVGMNLYTIEVFLFVNASEDWMTLVFLISYCLKGIEFFVMQTVISEQVLA